MNEIESPKITSRYPKINLTAITTGLVSLCNLIQNPAYQKACIILSPAVTLVSTWFFSMLKNYMYNVINHWRGVKTYKKIIMRLTEKLEKAAGNKRECAKIRKEIEKFEQDLHQLEIKHIQVFI